jgi:hypothetical protein
VEEAVSDQQQLVDSFSQALSGETPVEGEDSSWVQIGGISFWTTALVKSPLGEPLFTITIKAVNPTVKIEHKSSAFPVIVKRSPEGGVDKILIDFTELLAFSNLGANWSKEQTEQGMEFLAKLGLAKKNE